ncbi:carbonic anhydrase family protein [Fructobacillus sp. M1-13]|uniref:carbonic anhydrase n=1 Tax=Fructobacillus papyriferae TaxID=2713171 RepID=A0ABS5QPR0_9LACO|nr:carbonic anhydrase family protein [Fructobacillus papyriferae]MBS9335151.1 carbonic anhydrase family protein [Fructobacillus papyriferae]MCD2159179.1 carbonic anhydrase family protein [Fructobacillus papyriferae]
MDKLDYQEQSAWRYTTKERAQSPIDVTQSAIQKGEDWSVDWSGLGKTAVLKKKPVIGDQFFATGQLKVNDRSYDLVRFHLHDGAEHYLFGKKAAAELHLVFQRPDGGTLVLAIFLEKDEASALQLAPILNGEEAFVDLQDLLPKNIQKGWAYQGTLTTPPLKEDVAWLLVDAPLAVHQSDLAFLKKSYPDNHRKVQPLNGRAVIEHRLVES